MPGVRCVSQTCRRHGREPIISPFPAIPSQSPHSYVAGKASGGAAEQAAESARTAAELAVADADIEINMKARQALIAALADSGMLAAAWTESQVLGSIISDEVDEQLAGKAYWVIGNVAFLCNNVEEGLRYHELAAANICRQESGCLGEIQQSVSSHAVGCGRRRCRHIAASSGRNSPLTLSAEVQMTITY